MPWRLAAWDLMTFPQTNRNTMVDREIRLLSLWLLTPIAPKALLSSSRFILLILKYFLFFPK